MSLPMEASFSPWLHWTARDEYSGIEYPGIYVVAVSRPDISGELFSFREEIVYIGMTNAIAGLKGRLTQFDNTIARKHLQHGGADRVLFKHQNYATLVRRLFVSLRHFRCHPENETPSDLRTMGRVANAEYQCMARHVEIFGALPEFNRKKESLKYSLTYGRS